MAIEINPVKSAKQEARVKDYPVGSARFDWIAFLLSAWIVVGYFLIVRAFIHGQSQLTSPLSVAGLVYAGISALVVFLLTSQWRYRSRGHDWQWALPQGYGLSLVGAGVALIGAVLYPIWQSLLPPTNGLEAGLVMPGLVVNLGLFLIASGPIRAARVRLDPSQAHGWSELGPLVLSMVLVLSLLTNLTLFANPIFEPYYGPYGGATAKIDQGKFSDLYLMNADGSGQTRLTEMAGAYSWSSDWSPDGKQIVFTRGEPGDSESALYIMHADSSGLRQLTAMPGQEWVPSWSPDGLRIAFVSKTPRDQQIFSVNADGSDLRQLTHSFAPTYGPDWSPDGTRIVYNSNASGTDQLYIMQADGTNPKQITSQGENNWGAAWSPDGNWIAFNSVRGSDPDLFLVHPDGSGEQRLTVDPGRKTTPTWSSDGRQIAFSFDRDGQYDIKVINADGTNIGNLTHNHALEFVFPKWSPDGTQIMVTASGHPTLADAFQLQDLGVAGILIQSALLIGAVLMLIGSWRLPIGALTVLFTVNGLLMATLADRYLLIIPMFLAGLVADALLMWLKPSAARRRAYIFFAAAVPVTLYGLYFLTLQLTQGMSWGIHLWLGALVIAGLGGWLVGFLFMWAGSIARATAS